MKKIYNLISFSLIFISALFFTNCYDLTNSDSSTKTEEKIVYVEVEKEINIQPTTVDLDIYVPKSRAFNRFLQATVVTLDDVSEVNLTVLDSSGSTLSTKTLTESSNTWSGTINDLPVQQLLTFTVNAYDSSHNLIFTGSKTDTLSTTSASLAIEIASSNSSTVTFTVPSIYGHSLTFSSDTNESNITFMFLNTEKNDLNWSIQWNENKVKDINSSLKYVNGASNYGDNNGTLSFGTSIYSELNVTVDLNTSQDSNDSNVISLTRSGSDFNITREFSAYYSETGISIAFAPIIKTINLFYTESNVTAEANISTDLDSSKYSFKWSLAKGTTLEIADLDSNSSTTENNNSTVVLSYKTNSVSDVLTLQVSTATNDNNFTTTASVDINFTVKNTTTSTTTSSTPTTDQLYKTGQTTSYLTYDDGHYKEGVTRYFTRDDTNNTVENKNTTDALTWEDQTSIAQRNYSNAVSYCNDLTLDGYTDWRLPTIHELKTLVNYSKTSPVIDGNFSNTNWSSTDYYWSSNPSSYSNSYLTLKFYDGRIQSKSETSQNYIRCVRGTTSTQTFTKSSNIVTDSFTNLMWQDNATDTNSTYNWSDAITYCEGLTLDSHSDWRLPNINELISIIKYDATTPAKFDSSFENNQSKRYWSSTTSSFSTSSVWTIDFSTGLDTYLGKTNSYYIRCVRN
jgi:hypothetical protein